VLNDIISRARTVFAWLVMFFVLTSCTPVPQSPTAINIDTNTAIVDEGPAETVPASLRHARTLRMSKESAVVAWGTIGGHRAVRGSGTYFEHKGSHIVITAYHVYDDPRISGAMIQSQDGEMVAGTIIYSNRDRDICVLLVPKMRTVEAARLNPIRPAQADEGTEVLYTGFPGNHQHTEPLTLNGTLAGIDDDHGFVIMQSYAWMGSSGSGVFDSRGRYIGVLVAIDINRGIFGPQLQENIVYVSPIWGVNVEEIEGLLEE
jgi:S1-C subfamily serine protease